MTKSEMITMLKVMTGSTDDESVLSTYLELAGRKIIAKAFPYRTDVTEVPSIYEYLQVEIAAYMLNKRGAEGQTAHTENGITRQYENADVPSSMLKTITPHVGTFSSEKVSTT